MSADDTTTPTMAEALKRAIDSALAEVHTNSVGQVTGYDPKKLKATVQPLLKRVFKDGEVRRQPAIVEVPVQFPGGGGGRLTFPIDENDTVLLSFVERSIDKWLKLGGEIEPDDPRKHDISDAIAGAVISDFSNVKPAHPTDVELEFEGLTLRLQPGGKIVIGKSGVELLQIVTDLLDALAIAVTAAGGGPLSEVATFEALSIQIATIRGSL